MKTILKSILLVALISLPMSAQQMTFQDSLLDHMIGKWMLRGQIAGKETVHDLNADCVCFLYY